MTSPLTLTVEGELGCDILQHLIPKMVELATHLQCDIKCEANGRTIIAHSGDFAEELVAAWNNSSDKLVFVRR